MARVVLSVTVKKSGVLADADSTPVWADQAGTYGVKRTDTGEIIIPLNTPLGVDGVGRYSTTIDPAEPGVTYQGYAKTVVNGQPYWALRRQTAGVAPASRSYLTSVEAGLVAGALPAVSLPAWNAASDGDRTAALELASADVDAAGPWQGRKYDAAQVLEFPRVAYETMPGPFPMAGTRGVADVVWDWDEASRAAVVPLNVKRAVVYQAEAILAGTKAAQLEAQHGGLASQSVGGMSESYRDPAAGGSVVDGPGVLARQAATLLSRYRLKTGRLL